MDINFFLRFALTSYAAIVFFIVGMGLAMSKDRRSIVKILCLFAIMAVSLSLVFIHESQKNRPVIFYVWGSLILLGARFGRKAVRKLILKNNTSDKF